MQPLVEAHAEMECALCLSVYRKPMSAPCGHSFCQECLNSIVAYNDPDHSDSRNTNYRDRKVLCPLCRKIFKASQAVQNYSLEALINSVRTNPQKTPLPSNPKENDLPSHHHEFGVIIDEAIPDSIKHVSYFPPILIIFNRDI
eukprot:m.131241 g.131241  ORF g.131241 m.131241 type:complete len:143 (+) comp14618_c0_seq3:122-550(+)